MSSTRTQLSKFPSHDWLIKILSISVAVLLVIRVGLVIVGIKLGERFAVRNLSVGPCFEDLSRSKLWSKPIMIPCWSNFFNLQTKSLYWSTKLHSGVLGGQFKELTNNFSPFFREMAAVICSNVGSG